MPDAVIQQVDVRIEIAFTNSDDEKLKQASMFAFYLWKWVRSITNLIKIFQSMKPFVNKKEINEAKLDALTKQKLKTEDEMVGIIEQISELDK